VGGEILGKHGLHGTYYVCMGLVNTQNSAGERFAPDDLPWLSANGHEIGCHTYSHLSLRDHSAEEIASDLDRNRLAFQEVLPNFTPLQFAYPYGHISLAGWRLVKSRFETCRSVMSGIHYIPERFDRLLANPIDQSVLATDGLRLIDAVMKKSGWLIFYTHDVSSTPSRYGCTPQHLETIISASAASGAEILTVGEAARKLKRPP